jgi:selenocysteine lyase/cysteine desulfurase
VLTCQRHEFSLPEGLHYLNCAYMSPLPGRVEQAGIVGLRRKRVPSDIEPRHFFEEANRARQRFGTLIGGAPERVAMIPAVSYAVAMLARNTPCARGQNIVLSGEQFPSNVHAWRRLAQRSAAEVRAVPAPASSRRGESWNAALLQAIDTATAVVALPQVHWTDGTRFDLERLGEKARSVGAAFIVDATQSVGAFPFDQQRVRADAVICAAYKWLLGPYATGAVWIGPRYDAAEPLEETWIGRAGSEDFRGLVHYRDEYQPGAARFDVGENSNFALLPMLVAGLDLVLEWRPDRIQEYCRALVSAALEEARSLGFTVEDDTWRASHLFGLRTPPGLDVAALGAELQRRGVSVSLRGSALRVAPHLYNDDTDMAALLAALRAARGVTSSAAAPRTPA